MLNWRQSTRNAKVKLFSAEMLQKIILDLLQYSLSKGLQHLKWQQQKSWMSFPDCLVAMDKQQTQYRIFPKSKWKMIRNYSKNIKTECPDIWIRLSRHKWPKSLSSMEDPGVLFERNSWDSLGKVDLHRGEHLLGRTAHSVRDEETVHDKTRQPVSENVQGKANFEKFIMGSDTTEFVNKVRNQVWIRQKRMSDNA